MRNLLLALAVVSILGAVSAALAQDGTSATAVSTALEEEAVSSADLGVAEPTVLPTSPFYFLKTFTRAVQSAFTFNPVKKAELELRIADEKLAEAKKLAEVQPEHVRAIERAIENYRRSAERVAARLESLRETSQNPNVDRLLDTLADRTVKHEKIFDELKTKFEGEGGIQERLETVARRVEETAAAAATRDDPEKFARKLERALVETKGSDFKHLRSIEIIDRIHDKADDALKEKLTAIRNDFSERLKEDLTQFATERGDEASKVLSEIIEQLPGNRARRLIILEELQTGAAPTVGTALHDAAETLEREVGEDVKLAAHAEDAIRHAQERIEKLEAKLKEIPLVSAAVERHAHEARSHLANAKRAFEAGQFGEAFGQARSAEMLARGALRMLEEERPESGELKEKIAALESEINSWETHIGSLPPDSHPKAKEALEQARKHLALAAESLAKNAPREARQHLEEAKSYLHLLERMFEAAKKSERGATPKPAAVRPTPIKLEPTPILSRCEGLKRNLAELETLVAGGDISKEDYNRKYETLKRELAACADGAAPVKPAPPSTGSGQAPLPPKATEDRTPPREIACTQEYAPVCGADGKTYSNACQAKVASVDVKYRGVCGQSEETAKPVPPSTGSEQAPPPPMSVEPVPPTAAAAEFKIEADDNGFYPSNVLTVPKGAKVMIHFIVREKNVYYGGLDFRSTKFKTEPVKPGGTTTVTFDAGEGLRITSYWPLSNTAKAELKIEVQ